MIDPLIARVLIVACSIAVIAIRSPHGARSREIKVARTYVDWLDRVLMALTLIGFVLAMVWAVSPLLALADYPLRTVPFLTGVAALASGLWLLYRSHADLGTNWSVTLQIREGHRLVSDGIYRRIRHPMYLAFLLYALGQALVVPNWVAGPAYLATFALLVAMRVSREERMMLEQFGEEYAAYAARTKRLVPRVW